MGWSVKISMKKRPEEGRVAVAAVFVLVRLGFWCAIFDLLDTSCRPPNVLTSYVSFLIGIFIVVISDYVFVVYQALLLNKELILI